MIHVGIDVHQKSSQICQLSEEGVILETSSIPSTESAYRRWFQNRGTMRIVIECGGSSRWVARLLREMEHKVLVVNPRRVRLIAESSLKTDRIDAEVLARLSCFGRGLLRPIYQRGEESNILQTRLRVRSTLVRSRTAMINSVRGVLRSYGFRIPGKTIPRFSVGYASLKLPSELRKTLDPLFATIVELTMRIDILTKRLNKDSRQDVRFRRLQTVPGVGPMVSLAFVSLIDNPHRFRKSRHVGAYLGLRPRIRQSGSSEQRGPITKEGNAGLRCLLVQAAHSLLRCRQESALLTWSLALVDRIGKKKAVVGIARKLAVLLHHLWINEEEFLPFPSKAKLA